MIQLSHLPKTANRLKKVKRLGCGHGSGHGKTSSRGHKGGNARSGYSMPSNFSGIPLYRHFPKRGFNHARFKTKYNLISLSILEKKIAKDFSGIIDGKLLAKLHLVEAGFPIKLLGNGEVTRAFSLKVDKVTGGARKKIEAVGGTIVEES